MKKLAFLFVLAAFNAHAGDVRKFNTGPLYPFETAGASSNLTCQIDNQNEACAACWMQEEDATITTLGFQNGLVGGTAASITDDSYTISLQSMDGSGLPGGILGGGTPASATFPTAGAAGGVTLGTGTNHFITLANSYAVQRGTPYCAVVQRTGADSLTNYITVRQGRSSNGVATLMPYVLTADATPTWTKGASVPWGWAARSATKTYLYPVVASAQQQQVGGTSEKGFTFTFDPDFGTSNSIGLCGVNIGSGSTGMAAAGTFKVVLYSDPTGTPVIRQETTTIDSDWVSSTTGGRGYRVTFPEDAPYALVPGTKYGVAFSHSAATSWSIDTYTLPDADSRSAYPMGGLTLATRTLTDYPPSGNDSNAFSETTTTIVNATLEFCDFTAAAGGSGSMGGVY